MFLHGKGLFGPGDGLFEVGLGATGFEPVTFGSGDSRDVALTTFPGNDLQKQPSPLGVSWECPGGTECQCPAASDTEFTPSIQYIADAWPHLQPHVREAIFTLIDAALDQQELERGQS